MSPQWSGSIEAARQFRIASAKVRSKKKKLNAKQRRASQNANKKKRIASDEQRITYKWYMRSSRWKKKRAKFIKMAGNKCERCGAGGPFNVHHKHYKTLGREEKGDVEVLCRYCHQCEHEPDGVKMTDEMSAAFRATIL